MPPISVISSGSKKILHDFHKQALTVHCSGVIPRSDANKNYFGVLFYDPAQAAYLKSFIRPVKGLRDCLKLIARENTSTTFQITSGHWIGGYFMAPPIST